jgi:dihydroorotase
MKTLFKNANVYMNGECKKQDMLLCGAVLSVFRGEESYDVVIDGGIAIFPGFCDVHVHFREPGFSYKETVKSGSRAAARGGYTAVCTMPNLSPAPDCLESLKAQLDIIERDSVIATLPYGTITKGQMGQELSDMEAMAPYVVGFSDDGRGVQSEEVMEAAMLKAKALGKPIVAHCEDNSLLRGGYIHDGEYAKAHGHRGIPSESEWGPIARDLKLVEKTGVTYHVCHVSAKESVRIIREAKRQGLNVSCETGPHYLTMDDSELLEEGRFKMNPPIRGEKDKDELIKGISDGTVDVIATDHAPHSAEEKSRGLQKSLMGVVGIETAFPVIYTDLVLKGKISLADAVRLLSDRPRERFNITTDTGFTIFKLDEEYEVNPSEFISLGKSSPFTGKRVFGRCLCTVYDGKVAYLDQRLAD